ncbi:MAG TPA: ABC transporter substrate-binding protein [Paenalcaligenes sp.]|nr:ABC transporter substrate-binding protein [Paenalcaligenes sp.]
MGGLINRKLVNTLRFSGVIAFTLSSAIAVAATPSDTLVIAKTADPQTLDPAITMDNNDWSITYPTYQNLVRYQKGSTEVEGELAESWEASDDNLVWTFKLRSGQQFNDGSDVDAAAVKYTFDRLMRINQGPAEPFPEGLEVVVVDPLTVEFRLPRPFAPFLNTLANNGAGIINPAVEDAEGGADQYLSANTAGSGPFQLTKWDRGQSLVLEKNPHYGDTEPALERVVFRVVPESSARRLQLENGDLDIVNMLPVDQIEALQANDDLVIQEVPSLLVTYLYLNNRDGLFSDINARQAITYAIDYDGIIEGVLDNQGQQMTGPIPEGMWGHDESLAPIKQDLDKAQSYIDQVSGAQEAVLLYSDRDPNWEPIALTVQANMAALGINVKLEKLANATMRDRLDKGDFDIALGNWSPDFADPFMFMNYWFDSERGGLPGNRAFYDNAQVDELIRKAAEISDQDERAKLYGQAQDIIMQEYPYVYLFQKAIHVGLRDNIQGYEYNPMLDDVYNVHEITKK